MLHPNNPISITAIILAGGRGSRMKGADKGWLEWRGRPMVNQVLERLQSQVDSVIISCNRNLEQYQALGPRCVSDGNNNFLGPLAGVLAASEWVNSSHVLLCPCDTPLLPSDLRIQLQAGLEAEQAQVAIPRVGKQAHYSHALVGIDCTSTLAQRIEHGQLALKSWLGEFRISYVDFPDASCFRNINTPQDLE